MLLVSIILDSKWLSGIIFFSLLVIKQSFFTSASTSKFTTTGIRQASLKKTADLAAKHAQNAKKVVSNKIRLKKAPNLMAKDI